MTERKDKVVAFVEGGDDSQRFFTKKELSHALNEEEKAWWAKARPGDMRRIHNGGYFPGTDAIVIKLGRVTESTRSR